jgi:hypothetical protein
MEDLQGLGFIPNSIVHMDRRVENAAHFRETFDGLAEAREVSQKIDVVHQRNGESLRVRGVILPGPRDNLVQIG